MVRASGRVAAAISAGGPRGVGNGVTSPIDKRQVKARLHRVRARGQDSGQRHAGRRRARERHGWRRKSRRVAGQEVRPRSGSHQGGAPMAVRARHVRRQAGGRARPTHPRPSTCDNPHTFAPGRAGTDTCRHGLQLAPGPNRFGDNVDSSEDRHMKKMSWSAAALAGFVWVDLDGIPVRTDAAVRRRRRVAG